MSLRQQGWGELTFVPPIPTPKIGKRRIWKIPQIQEPEPEDAFEDAKEDQDDQFEDSIDTFIEEDQPEFYTTERSLREFEDAVDSSDNEPDFYTTESLTDFNSMNPDTVSWLYIINSMGFDREKHTFDSSKSFLEWEIENINYHNSF